MSFSFGRKDSSSLFSLILSLWLLKTVKNKAAETTAPPNVTTAHCLIPDNSLKFAIGPPLRLPLPDLVFPCCLVASQGELKRLHVFDGFVLIGFLDLDRAEEPGLLQVGNQVRHCIGAQGC